MKINVVNRTQELFPQTVDLDAFHSMLEDISIYNPFLGPVRNVFLVGESSLGLSVYTGVAEHSKIQKFLKRMIKGFIPTSGKAQSLSDVFFSTMGEAIERILPFYSAFQLQNEGKITYATVKDMLRKGENILGPDKLHLFSKEQYSSKDFLFKQYDEKSLVGWIEGKNLLTNEKIYVPAQIMVFGYGLTQKEAPIGYPSSAGLTCHVSSKHAFFHGLCEFAERDAINVHWVCNFPPKHIVVDKPDQLPESVAKSYETMPYLKNPYIDTRIYDWSVDIPEIFALSIHSINTSYNTFKYLPGMGADISYADAFDKALREVAQAERNYLVLPIYIKIFEGLPPWMNVSPDAKAQEIDNLFKAIVLYGYDKNLKKLEEWYGRSKKVNLSEMNLKRPAEDIDSKYDYLLDVFRKNNMTPLAFDLTPKEFKNLKLHKVFVPELTSYFLVYPLFGHPRYREVGQRLGEIDHLLTFDDLNKAPVPFP